MDKIKQYIFKYVIILFNNSLITTCLSPLKKWGNKNSKVCILEAPNLDLDFNI